MFTTARLLFSGLFERLLKAGSAVLEWLLSDWRNGPLVLFFALFLVNAIIIKPSLLGDIAERTKERDAAIAEREETLDAFHMTVANYIQAAKRAQRDAEANIARVEAEQATINQETVDDFEARLAAARAVAERLNSEGVRTRAVRSATGNPRGARQTDLPGTGNPAGGSDEATGDPRLSYAWSCLPGFVCLTIDEALIATEQAIQLDALIEWNERQAAVPFSTEIVDD